MKPLDESRAGRLLRLLAAGVIRHKRLFFYLHVVLVLICLVYTVAKLRISMDRNDLISVEESYRRQFLEFRKEFNIRDNLFVVVESGSRAKNREFVERLAVRLRNERSFSDIYYRAGLKLMGPKALLFLPEESLSDLLQNLRTNKGLLQTYSQATSLNSLLVSVNRQFRLSDRQELEKAQESHALARSLPILRQVVDRASDCIQSQASPLVPTISTLVDGSYGTKHQDLYLSFDGGRIYLLMAEAKTGQENAAIKQLRKLIAETRSEVPGVNAEITGESVLRHDEMDQARRDTELAAIIALALTAAIFVGSCQDILRPLMATICLLAGICYSLGFAAFTVGRLNILSITLVPILIGLAIDYGVHLICRYDEELRHGRNRSLAVSKALSFTGLGVIGNALTIAGAFYCMMLTDFKGMQEMGLIAGSGVLVCLFPMLSLLPLLLVMAKEGDPAGGRARGKPIDRDPLKIALPAARSPQRTPCPPCSRLDRIGQLYLKRPWLLLLGGTVFTVWMVIEAMNVQFDYNLLNLQSRGLPSVRMQKQLIGAGSQSLLYCAVTADSLPQAAEWERRITQLPSVGRVISLVKYLTEDQERKLALIRQVKQEMGAIRVPEFDPQPVNLTNLNQTLFSLSGYLTLAVEALSSIETNKSTEQILVSLHSSVNRLRHLIAEDPARAAAGLLKFQQGLFASLTETVQLIQQQDDRARLQPGDVPAFLRAFFISRSGKFLLQVYPKDDVWQRDTQEEFIRELRAVDPNVTGSPVQLYEYTSRLRTNIQRAAGYAAAIIAVLVFVHFRRVSSVVLALLPVALGLCWMLGLMGWLGIEFNPVNIVSLVLVIGIGVTNGIHILNRFAEEPHPNILARSTGRAVLISALNTMAGFGSLLIAKHQGIASLGGIMALGTATCVVASLAFLPALLTILAKVGWCPTDPPSNTLRAGDNSSAAAGETGPGST